MNSGRGGSLLREALLRHGRLLEDARKHQLAGKQPTGAVLAVNGVSDRRNVIKRHWEGLFLFHQGAVLKRFYSVHTDNTNIFFFSSLN